MIRVNYFIAPFLENITDCRHASIVLENFKNNRLGKGVRIIME